MSPSRAKARQSAAPKAETRFAAPLVVLLIVVCGLGTYGNSLDGPFIWDDQISIVTNASIERLWPPWEALNPPRETPVAGRPIVNLSLALNYALGGMNESGYHAFNVVAHGSCALVLFGIVRRTLANLAREKGVVPLFRSPDLAALAIALIWLVHPLQSEVVNYVTQRSESLMALFLLLTLYCAIRARRSSGSARTWQGLAVLACACGMATKESMVVAPLIVILYDRAFEFDSLRAAMRERAPFYTGLAATWVIAAAMLLSAPRSTVGASATVGPWTYLLNQAEMIGRYLRLSVWPRALVLDYGLPRALTLGDVLPEAAIIVALAVAGSVALVRWPAIGFLAAFFFLTLAPTSSVIPIRSEVGAERRMYLPLAALVTLGVMAVRALIDRASAVSLSTKGAARPNRVSSRVAAAGVIVVLLTLAARTMARNAEYRDPLALWRADVARRPHGRSRMALATELATAGQHAEATEQLRLAVSDFPDARAALGTELILQQQFEEGTSVLRRFIADRPSLANRIPAHVLLAQAFSAQQKLEESAGEWRAVLALAPGNQGARENLAGVLASLAQSALQQDDANRGEAYAREAVTLAPANAVALNLLGVAVAFKGNLEQARTHFQEALRLAPNDPQARANLERADRALAAVRSKSNR